MKTIRDINIMVQGIDGFWEKMTVFPSDFVPRTGDTLSIGKVEILIRTTVFNTDGVPFEIRGTVTFTMNGEAEDACLRHSGFTQIGD